MVALRPILELSSVSLWIVSRQAEAFVDGVKDILHIGSDAQACINALQAAVERIAKNLGRLLDQPSPLGAPDVMMTI